MIPVKKEIGPPKSTVAFVKEKAKDDDEPSKFSSTDHTIKDKKYESTRINEEQAPMKIAANLTDTRKEKNDDE